MPLTVPAMSVRLPPPGQRMAPVCVLLSALIFGASLVLACLPLDRSEPGFLSALQQLLPLLAAAMGLVSGALCIFAGPADEPKAAAASPDASAINGLQSLVRQLTGVLQEEHGQVTAFQEIYANSTREALVVSRRLALLADVAIDAENRLVAGVAQADQALRQAPGGTAAGAAQRGLPEIADLLRRGLAEQARTIASMLDAVLARTVSEADSPIQAFRTAVAGANGQIKTLAETAVTLSRGVAAFDAAGRGIATASTAAVSRVNEAVAHVDTVLAQLPDAAARVGAAAEHAAQTIVASADALGSGSAAMQQAAASIQEDTEALRLVRQDLTQAGATVVARIGDGVSRVDTAVNQLPAAVDAISAASGRMEQTIAEASRVLCGDSATLAASGQETHHAANALRQEAASLKTAGQQMSDAGNHAIAAVTRIVETSVAQLGAVIADADIARQGTAGLAELAATLESAASTLVDGAYSLDAAGSKIAQEGEKITERLGVDAARNGAVLEALPNAAAGIMAAMEALRVETSVLTGAADKVSLAGQAATTAVTDVAARVQASAASLDASGRTISAVGLDVAAQIGHLSRIADHAESQATLLPAIAADIAVAAGRLQALTEAWRPDAMLTILPDAAARLDAAGPRLDQLVGLSERLEHVVAGLEAGQAQEAALATMAVLSTDIGEAVRRVEAALSDHEEAWPAVVASVARIQAGSGDAGQIPANSWTPEIIPDGVVAPLRHPDSAATPHRDVTVTRSADDRPRLEPTPIGAARPRPNARY